MKGGGRILRSPKKPSPNRVNMSDQGGECSFFEDIHVRTDIGKNISISIRPMTTKFGKQVHLRKFIRMSLLKQVLVTSSIQDHVTN